LVTKGSPPLQKRIQAANGAVDYAIEYLRTHPGECGSGSASSSGSVPGLIDERAASWTCTETVGPAGGTGSDWAVFITGYTINTSFAAFSTATCGSGCSGGFTVNGSIYNGYRSGTDITKSWSLAAPLTVTPPAFVKQVWTNTTGATVTGINQQPAFVTSAVSLPAPREPLGTAPAAAAAFTDYPAGGGEPACRAFKPGKYIAAMAMLSPPAINFFEGGTYYFENTDLNLSTGLQVVAGRPQNGEAPPAHSCAQDTTAAANGGVMLVFGGSAKINMHEGPSGSSVLPVLDVYPRSINGGPGVAIYQVTTTGSGFVTSTATAPSSSPPGTPAFIDTDEDRGQIEMAIYGQVYAPTAMIWLEQERAGVVKFMAGVVAAQIRAELASGASGLSTNQSRTISITGTGNPLPGEPGAPVVASAVVTVNSNAGSVPQIASWRLS
jgi:hypothetical protein